MNGDEIILTMPAKLGDGLYSLMVGSWLYQTRGQKIHWVLSKNFGPFLYVSNLLRLQTMTSRVSLVDHKFDNFDCGGQPYKFDPWNFHDDLVHEKSCPAFGLKRPSEVDCICDDPGEYYNLGFRHYPTCFLPQFYAEEYELGYDADFRMLIREPTWVGESDGFKAESGEVLRSSERSMERLAPQATSLPTHEDLLALVQRIQIAKEFHTWFCGMAVLCWMAGVSAHVYRVPGHAPLSLYFPDPRGLVFHEVTL